MQLRTVDYSNNKAHAHTIKLLYIKQLLDEAFVISRIIKVEVGVINRSRRLRLITLTENESFLSRFDIKCFQSLCQLFLFLRFSQIFLFHVTSKQLLCHLRRSFCVCESLSSTIFSMSCSVNEANLEVMFLLLHGR